MATNHGRRRRPCAGLFIAGSGDIAENLPTGQSASFVAGDSACRVSVHEFARYSVGDPAGRRPAHDPTRRRAALAAGVSELGCPSAGASNDVVGAGHGELVQSCRSPGHPDSLYFEAGSRRSAPPNGSQLGWDASLEVEWGLPHIYKDLSKQRRRRVAPPIWSTCPIAAWMGPWRRSSK